MAAIGVIALIAGLLMYGPVAKKTKEYVTQGNTEKASEGRTLRNGMVLMIGTGTLLICLELFAT